MKKFNSLLCSLMIALAGFSVMTCSEEEQAHEHNFTISAFDDIHHWKKCNCGEVDLSSYEKHHNESNTDTHWFSCDCGVSNEKKSHEWILTETLDRARYQYDGLGIYSCSACTEKKEDIIPAPEPKTLEELGALKKLSEEEINAYGINKSSIPQRLDGAEYYTFGVYPQTVLAQKDFDEGNIKILDIECTESGITYKMGDDCNWYVEVPGYEFGYSSSCKYSDGTFANENIRYFKAEPLVWRKLADKNVDGKNCVMLVSEKAVDFCSGKLGFNKKRNIDGNVIFNNNYKHSITRAFLNGLSYEGFEDYWDPGEQITVHEYENNGFLQKAFTLEQSKRIVEYEVDNSPESADFNSPIGINNKYYFKYPDEFYCENTKDKIFLLSFKEATSKDLGFIISSTSPAIAVYCPLLARKATDFAIYKRKNESMPYSLDDEIINIVDWPLRTPISYIRDEQDGWGIAGAGFDEDIWVRPIRFYSIIDISSVYKASIVPALVVEESLN